jgi:hypothetical protein
MPSARELLEQADALMRKNRTRGDGDIPLLTDAVALVPVSLALPVSVPQSVAPPVSVPQSVAPPPAAPAAPIADVPVLTDAVEEDVVDFEALPEPRAALVAIMEGDPSDWLVMDTIDPASHSITGRAPDTLAVVPPMTLKAAGSEPTPPPMGSQPHLQKPAPIEPFPSSWPVPAVQAPERVSVSPAQAPAESVPAATVPAERALTAIVPAPVERDPRDLDDEHWRALAEQVSMQVLQRLDLFTDSGLKEQLARRLEPIVERASVELVGEIAEHVGRLVRTYVSEAIEREIAQWKRDQH